MSDMSCARESHKKLCRISTDNDEYAQVQCRSTVEAICGTFEEIRYLGVRESFHKAIAMLIAIAEQILIYEILPKCLTAARSAVMASHMPPNPSVSARLGRTYIIDHSTLGMSTLDHGSSSVV